MPLRNTVAVVVTQLKKSRVRIKSSAIFIEPLCALPKVLKRQK